MATSTSIPVSLPMPRIPRTRRSPQEIADASPNVNQRKVLLAAPRGYCAGVDRAVVAVEKALEHYGPPVYVRKQIVHNLHVVSELEARGAIFVEETDEVPRAPGGLLRPRRLPGCGALRRGPWSADHRRHLPAGDQGAPRSVRFAKNDYEILLIGHEGHEEVEGTYGEAPHATTIVNNPEEADTVQVKNPDKLIWLSQTTLSVDETMETVRRLRERFPNLQDPPSDDICYATTNRQVAIKTIAPKSDLVIVVGSSNSSNSVRLVEVSLDYGAKAAYRVDFAHEVDESWFEGVSTVGVTSGASVPDVLVQEVLELLAEYGFGDVEEITLAEEDIVFSLPKEIRGKLKEAGDDSRALGGRGTPTTSR